MSGIHLFMGGDRPRVALTSGTLWTPPAGVISVTAYVWGPGGRGGIYYGGGGGGGGLSIETLILAPGIPVPYQIGAAGTDTWFASISDVLAKAGADGPDGTPGGTASNSGGLGGQASSGVGSQKWSGGSGGHGTDEGQGGGGGGPAGLGYDGRAGGNGGSTTGGGGGGVGGPLSTDGIDGNALSNAGDGGLGPTGLPSGGSGTYGTVFTPGLPFSFQQWSIGGVPYGPGGGAGGNAFGFPATAQQNGADYGGGAGGVSGTTYPTPGRGLIIIEY